MPTRARIGWCSNRGMRRRPCTGSFAFPSTEPGDERTASRAGGGKIRDREAAAIEGLIAAGTGAAAVGVPGTPVEACIRALECPQQSIHQSVHLRLYLCCVSRRRADRVGLLRVLLCLQLREAALLRHVAAVELVHGLLFAFGLDLPALLRRLLAKLAALHEARDLLAYALVLPGEALVRLDAGMPWAWACGTLAATKRVASARTATGNGSGREAWGSPSEGLGRTFHPARST